jgi:hypothetical protein
VFQLAALVPELSTWPIFDRVFRYGISAAEQEDELKLVGSGRLLNFLTEVDKECAKKTIKWRRCLIKNYQSYPLEKLLPLLNSEPNVERLAFEFLSAPVFLELPPSIERFELFLQQYKGQKHRGECSICSDCYSRFNPAIQLCNPDGEFPGHFICRKCATGTFLDIEELKCPFCRKQLPLYLDPIEPDLTFMDFVGTIFECISKETRIQITLFFLLVIFVHLIDFW